MEAVDSPRRFPSLRIDVAPRANAVRKLDGVLLSVVGAVLSIDRLSPGVLMSVQESLQVPARSISPVFLLSRLRDLVLHSVNWLNWKHAFAVRSRVIERKAEPEPPAASDANREMIARLEMHSIQNTYGRPFC
jgi:hypothetical protein